MAGNLPEDGNTRDTTPFHAVVKPLRGLPRRPLLMACRRLPPADEWSNAATDRDIMNHVEKLGDPLHFVDHHIESVRRSQNPFPQAFRPGRQLSIYLRSQEIERQRIR